MDCKMLCQLWGVAFESIMLLCLIGSAFTVCNAFYAMFTLDQYAVYEAVAA